MLRDFTISAIKFATFCLFVEAALIIFKNREEELPELIIDELSQEIKKLSQDLAQAKLSE